MIPPRIIQTGKTRELSLRAKASVATLRGLNPSFEYCFFDDREVATLVKETSARFYEAFQGFPFPIQRYDFFRYLAVFRLGGFYFDLDVFLGEALDELLERTCVFPFEELTVSQYLRRQHAMDWEIGNFGFGAEAGHPFLEAVIENCVRAQKDEEWLRPMMAGIPRLFRSDYYVLNTTGPGLLSRTLAENPALAKGVTVLFPDNVCDPSKWHQFGDFGVHAMDGSWRANGGYLRRRLGNLWEAWVSRKGMEESRKQGKTRPIPLNTVPELAQG